MLTSTRRGISYPNPATRADRADVPTDIATLIAALELDVVFGQGTLATRPAAGAGVPAATSGGRFWWATDTAALYYDTGAAWIGPLNQQALGANSITTAMLQDAAVTLAKLAANSVDATKIVDGSVGTAELAAALFPSQGAGAGTEALRALGTAVGQAARGDLSVWVFNESLLAVNLTGQVATGTWYSFSSTTIACQTVVPTTGTWRVEFGATNVNTVNTNASRGDKIGIGVNGANPVANSAFELSLPRALAVPQPVSRVTQVALTAGDTLTLLGMTVGADLTQGVHSSSHRFIELKRIA